MSSMLESIQLLIGRMLKGNRQRPSLLSIREWDVTVRVDLNINENASEQYRESDTKTDGFV